MSMFHVCYLLCCDSKCYQLPALFSGFQWSMAREGDGVVYKEHWYLWEMQNKSLLSCQLYVVIASSWLVALACVDGWTMGISVWEVQLCRCCGGWRVICEWVQRFSGLREGCLWVLQMLMGPGRECSFCLLEINNFLSIPVSYSICTLLAPYTATDPTVISCVKSTAKRSFIPLCCKRDTEIFCYFHYKRLSSYMGERYHVEMQWWALQFSLLTKY